jgi:hypothetical protein
MPEGRFWFRLPDDEAMLTSLKPAELRCYLVVMRDIQRSRHRGLISARQVSDKTGISLQHTHAALESLVANGHLNCEKRPGATTRFSLPFDWEQGNCSPVGEHHRGADRSPVGEQSDSRRDVLKSRATAAGEQSGEHQRSPVGEQHCSPVGEQLLESSESSELKKKKHDELPASQKNAKPANSKVGALHPYSETEIQLLKAEMAAITSMNVDLITDDAVAGSLAALQGSPLKGFIGYLANLSFDHREGGRKQIKHPWSFFSSVASDYARRPVETEPTSDRCRHGKPYGCCCNSPALNDWYTAAFDPTSDDGPSERPAV